jgi:hypothetical protein
MANITRTTARTALTRPSPRPKTKVLLVRQPVKQAQSTDDAGPRSLRLAIGVVAALGTVGLVWFMGHVGYRLGFAPILGVPELAGAPADGLASGVASIIAIPRNVILAGVAEPVWLMAAFVAIAIPASGISAVRARALGGPRPAPITTVFSIAGAVVGAVNAALLVWWVSSPVRTRLLATLPARPADGEAWLTNLQTAAGLDALAVIASALWVVLLMRIDVPRWLRALTASAAFGALAFGIVAMSLSGAAAAQMEVKRSVCFLDDGSLEARLLIGATSDHVAMFKIVENTTVIELLDRPNALTVVGGQSIIEAMEEHAPK